MARRNAILAGGWLLLMSMVCHAGDAQWSQYEQQFRQRNWVAAKQTLQALAESGDAKAYMTLAQWYRNGTGGNKDLQQARLWMQRAAEKGLADAQYQLGVMYVRGIGGSASPADAMHWLTQASRQNHARADEMLADKSWQVSAAPTAIKTAPTVEKALPSARASKEVHPEASPLQRKLAAVQQSSQRSEALRRAVLKNDLDVISALLGDVAPGADTQAFVPDAEGQTLVTLAAGAASGETLSLLLKYAPHAARVDADGRNALFHAVKGKRADNVSRLLAAGVDPLQADHKGITPMVWAIEWRSDMSTRMLAGIAPARWDPTWLVLAAKQGDQTLVKQLLDGKLPPNQQDAQGRTALWHAVQNRSQALIDMLLQAGASPTVADSAGNTPLHMASRIEGADNIEKLLRNAGSVAAWHRGNKQGATPLHVACESGNTAAAEVLVRHGATIDARDVAGNTPLMAAAGANQVAVVSWLVTHGASTGVRNHNKKNALDIAEQLGHREVVNALKTADAKRGVMSIFQ